MVSGVVSGQMILRGELHDGFFQREPVRVDSSGNARYLTRLVCDAKNC